MVPSHSFCTVSFGSRFATRTQATSHAPHQQRNPCCPTRRAASDRSYVSHVWQRNVSPRPSVFVSSLSVMGWILCPLHRCARTASLKFDGSSFCVKGSTSAESLEKSREVANKRAPPPVSLMLRTSLPELGRKISFPLLGYGNTLSTWYHITRYNRCPSQIANTFNTRFPLLTLCTCSLDLYPVAL